MKKNTYLLAGSICLLLIGGLSFNQFVATANAQTASAEDDTLYIKSITLTTAVENHEPVDTVQAFSVAMDSQAYCHVRVHNTTQPTTILFRWIIDGKEYYTLENNVGISTNWRTFGSIQPQPGNWEVQILSPAGDVLAQKSFSILEER